MINLFETCLNSLQIVRELAGAGERVAAVQRQKEALLSTRHPNAGSIRAKGQDVQQLWREVNETANERQVGPVSRWNSKLDICWPRYTLLSKTLIYYKDMRSEPFAEIGYHNSYATQGINI